MYSITLTTGNDSLNQTWENRPGTLVGLDGDDTIFAGNTNDVIYGNQGDDSLFDIGGSNTIRGGFGDDYVRAAGSVGFLYGNEGADTIVASSSFGVTLVGGQDSADAADSLAGSDHDDFILGNGGANIISGGAGTDTLVGGFDNDRINDAGGGLTWGNEGADTIMTTTATVFGGFGDDLITGGDSVQGNEGNDTILYAAIAVGGSGDDWIAWGANMQGNAGNDTILSEDNSSFGGDGNDSIWSSGGNSIQGNSGNDTIVMGGGPDTVAGGNGSDVFRDVVAYSTALVASVDVITDLNWSDDRFDMLYSVVFAADVGTGTRDTLNDSALAAITAATTLSGQNMHPVAAQFSFGGHTYLMTSADVVYHLIDITGATGTISLSNFI